MISNKNISRWIVFLCLICLISFILIKSGKNQDTIEEEQITSEAVLMTCYYKFSQQASFDEKPVELIDTVVLNFGTIYSEYYNLSSNRRDSIYNMNLDRLPGGYKNMTWFRKKDIFENRTKHLINKPDLISFIGNTNIESCTICINRAKNKVLMLDEGYEKIYACEETIESPAWTLLPETIEILGYKCMKAKTFFRGRNYFAWYAKDIPSDAGPWKLYGLPGLILKMEDEERLFVFEAISLHKNTNPDIKIGMGDDSVKYINNEIEIFQKRYKKKKAWIDEKLYANNDTLYFAIYFNKLKRYDMER